MKKALNIRAYSFIYSFKVRKPKSRSIKKTYDWVESQTV